MIHRELCFLDTYVRLTAAGAIDYIRNNYHPRWTEYVSIRDVRMRGAQGGVFVYNTYIHTTYGRFLCDLFRSRFASTAGGLQPCRVCQRAGSRTHVMSFGHQIKRRSAEKIHRCRVHAMDGSMGRWSVFLCMCHMGAISKSVTTWRRRIDEFGEMFLFDFLLAKGVSTAVREISNHPLMSTSIPFHPNLSRVVRAS